MDGPVALSAVADCVFFSGDDCGWRADVTRGFGYRLRGGQKLRLATGCSAPAGNMAALSIRLDNFWSGFSGLRLDVVVPMSRRADSSDRLSGPIS